MVFANFFLKSSDNYEFKKCILLNKHKMSSSDQSLREFVMSVLQTTRIYPKYIHVITNDKNMVEYSKVFTSKNFDSENNYEMYEQMGDLSINKFIVWYMYKRFPELRTSDGVKIVARLRINYASKESLFKISKDLGFWEHVRCTDDERHKRMKSLLEDVFEAFIGATECIIDDHFGIGVGYALVLRILENIFDGMNISLNYDDLYDPKTRLKELFDKHKATLGVLEYKDTRSENLVTSAVSHVFPNGTRVFLAFGTGSIVKNAHQKAAENALEVLKKRGFYKNKDDIQKFYSGINGLCLENPKLKKMEITTSSS
jgi:dsRNA-specific ribonuclease